MMYRLTCGLQLNVRRHLRVCGRKVEVEFKASALIWRPLWTCRRRPMSMNGWRDLGQRNDQISCLLGCSRHRATNCLLVSYHLQTQHRRRPFCQVRGTMEDTCNLLHTIHGASPMHHAHHQLMKVWMQIAEGKLGNWVGKAGRYART